MAQQLSKALQENILTLVCYNDDHCRMIRNAVPPELYESIYRDIATVVYAHIDRFKKAPKDHIADLLDKTLTGKDTRKARIFAGVLRAMREANETIDPNFVVARLSSFIRQQKLKAAILEAVEVLQDETPEKLDLAESIILKATKDRLDLFDPGVFLDDDVRSLLYLDRQEDAFPMGIPELDSRGLGPIRGGLHILIGLPKRGKSWHMVNLGRRASRRRLKVCHITLENSEQLTTQRYHQSFLSMVKRDGQYGRTVFDFEKVDGKTKLKSLKRVPIVPKLMMDDPDIRPKLKAKLKYYGTRFHNIIIKEFPTGSLTIPALNAYLDSLEMLGFIPDLLLIDSPDLMKVDTRNYRLDLGRLNKDLRGIGVERNMAVAAVTQSSKVGLNKKLVTEGEVSEDFSKVATADTVLTYSQTEAEKARGLARILVANARNDEDKFVVLISQHYPTGQFVLDSMRMPGKEYWDMIEPDSDTPPSDGGDDGEDE